MVLPSTSFGTDGIPPDMEEKDLIHRSRSGPLILILHSTGTRLPWKDMKRENRHSNLKKKEYRNNMQICQTPTQQLFLGLSPEPSLLLRSSKKANWKKTNPYQSPMETDPRSGKEHIY